MQANSRKIGIILVGYQDYVNRFLLECRDSLRAQNYPQDLYQVYIVDNCSINDCEFIKKNYPEAKCVSRLDGNYAAANNLGIQMARADNCQYFVIANMDTKFDPNWLSELAKAVEADHKIGIAQSKILLYPKNKEEWQKPKINSIGNIMHFLGFGFTRRYKEPDKLIKGLPEITYASGCSFIVKKEVLDKIGLYDEDYWMYHDDIEMSWRTRLAGYKIVLAPRSIVYHKYEFSRSVRMLYYMERNRYLAMFHYYKLATILLLLPAIITMEAGMIAYSLVQGWFGTKLKVIAYFLKTGTWMKIRKKRQLVKKIRKLSDKKIIKNFEGRVLFQEIENLVLKYIANPILNFYWRVIKQIILW